MSNAVVIPLDAGLAPADCEVAGMALRDAARAQAAGSKGQSVRIAGRWINNQRQGAASGTYDLDANLIELSATSALSGASQISRWSPVLCRPCSPQSGEQRWHWSSNDPGVGAANLQNTIILYHGTFETTCECMPTLCHKWPMRLELKKNAELKEREKEWRYHLAPRPSCCRSSSCLLRSPSGKQDDRATIERPPCSPPVTGSGAVQTSRLSEQRLRAKK